MIFFESDLFYRRASRLLSIVFTLILLGCTSPRLERTLSDIPTGGSYEVDNLYSVDQLPPGVRRVAVLPFYTDQEDALDRDRFHQMLQSQLRQTGRFEIFSVDQVELERLTGQRQLSMQDAIPSELVGYLKDAQVDAVFQLDVREYRAYRPFVLGVQARLFAVGSNEVLWAVDEVARSTEKTVMTAARHYSLEEENQRYPYSDSYSALRGPFLFAEFVIALVVDTLPAPS